MGILTKNIPIVVCSSILRSNDAVDLVLELLSSLILDLDEEFVEVELDAEELGVLELAVLLDVVVQDEVGQRVADDAAAWSAPIS